MADKKRPKMSLSTQVLLGFALGVAVGLFFGEMATSLKWIGDAFISLLQMTVLPYMFLYGVPRIGI